MSWSLSGRRMVVLRIVSFVVLGSMVLVVHVRGRACGVVPACSSLRPLLLPGEWWCVEKTDAASVCVPMSQDPLGIPVANSEELQVPPTCYDLAVITISMALFDLSPLDGVAEVPSRLGQALMYCDVASFGHWIWPRRRRSIAAAVPG